MGKGNVSKMLKDVQIAVQKHSPEILTGVGIAGMVTTTIMAVQATPKALMLIEQKKDEEGVNKLTPAETVKAAWKCYIPAAAVGSASVLCLVGASSVNLRRNAALATAYALSESSLRDYQRKVVEEIGEKKERNVRSAIAKDKIEKDPVTTKEVIITERGNTLCYDSLSHRYFMSDIDALKKAANELNRRMRTEMYVSLNEFYSEIGLDEIPIAHDLGWNINSNNDHIELDFDTHLSNDGRPCLVVDYGVAPRYDFR